MVKALFLGLLAAMMCGFLSAAPAPQIARSSRQEASSSSQPPLEDPAVRSERSTNLSHITGTARKIQMFIKRRHLQLLPDGTVNGTLDASSVHTILQRMTVGIGQLKIQGVASCQYLCMDSCGMLYGSREFGDECVFNEMIELHNYNTYSSTKYSNEKRTLYLALNHHGQPRRTMLRAHQQLGRLSAYTQVLTHPVSSERLDEMHHLRHQAHFCTMANYQPGTRLSSSTDPPTDPPRCPKRKKRKKKKRKCSVGEADSEQCIKKQNHATIRKTQAKLNSSISSRKCESEDSDECQRVDVSEKKRHKTKYGEKLFLGGAKKRKKHLKVIRSKKLARVNVSTELTVTDEMPIDEDYAVDTTTAWEWEDSTAMPDESGTPRPD